MNFSLFYQLKNNKSQIVNIVFYVAIILLIVAVFCYGIFIVKIYLQSQQIAKLDAKIAVFGTSQQKAAEQQVFDYKSKIGDYTALINSHRISLNAFNFIEGKTLPNVWFTNFDMSEVKNTINVLGQAQDMETLSNQVNIFEQSRDYVKSIGVLNFQISSDKKVKFTLSLSLDPKIFTYYPDGFPAASNRPAD